MRILYKISILWAKLLSIIFFALVGISFISPFYKFPPRGPFAGNNIYNPYQDVNSQQWIKANFQVQSKAWGGVTNGWNNTDSLIMDRYEKLGFDLVSISDYQKINTYNRDSEAYIPVYEHGYGIFKNHQVCLGARKVDWLDFPLFHTLHHKQDVLNRLKMNNELVAIAHPGLWNAYSEQDMEELTNYDLIEVLNNYKNSLGHWDAALSSGHPAFILANDDAHDVSKLPQTGRKFTVINAVTPGKEQILRNLKIGAAYGVELENYDSIFAEKAEKIKLLPHLLSVVVKADTVFYDFNKEAECFRFIGQGGEVLKIDSCTQRASYVLKPTDTYIRVEVVYDNHATFYLNPVFRHGNVLPLEQASATIDWRKTNIFRYSLFISLLLMVLFSLRFRIRLGLKPKEGFPVPA
ncbi:MAG: hypothetical protein K9H64_07925 [Bacteroidales bacterium]|nr:hypothetical protein [Bacteroidales bacterium]MCF8455729.1 hypothetical protein [Bacteroidales bacterium]